MGFGVGRWFGRRGRSGAGAPPFATSPLSRACPRSPAASGAGVLAATFPLPKPRANHQLSRRGLLRREPPPSRSAPPSNAYLHTRRTPAPEAAGLRCFSYRRKQHVLTPRALTSRAATFEVGSTSNAHVHTRRTPAPEAAGLRCFSYRRKQHVLRSRARRTHGSVEAPGWRRSRSTGGRRPGCTRSGRSRSGSPT